MTIGAAVAINVIPGVGQAISGAIVGALGGTFAAYGVAVTAVQALTLGLTVAGVQSLGGLLGLGPSMPKPDTATTAIKIPRPPRVSAYGISRLYGAYVLYETSGNGTAVDVHAIHDGRLTEVLGFYLADDRITLSGDFVNAGEDGRYGENKVSLYYTDGSTPGPANTVAMSLLPGIWTANHRGDGVVLISLFCAPVKSEDFLDIYPNGAPVPSMVAKWQRCPDPHSADPTNEALWTWTENPVRQLMHYKMVREGIDYSTKIAPTIEYWRAAADVCDEPVALKAGGTEARWRSWLAHKHTDKHGDVTAALLASCDGWMAPRSDGALVIFAGKYMAPSVTIGPEHIVAFEWQGVGVDDDEAVNEIICSYISAAHDYNSVECDAWRDEDDIAERGQILSDSLDPQVPSWGQVRRLAKRRMARTNALFRGTVTTNVAGRIARGHRYISLDLTESGATFYSGPVEITAVTRNMTTGGITFSWVQALPAIDSWNPATEEGEPAALGDRVAPEPLDPPSILSATPNTYDYGAQITVSVSGPIRPDLTWYIRWKISTDAIWSENTATDTDAGDPIVLITPIVPAGAAIDVQVAYGVGDGRTSDWSETATATTEAGDIIYDGGDAETEA
ncbi:hypothetical protein [Sphingobium sp.]|uniref:hypothetical protein n=1 Tax=Sphingobium sp. TaxID=1912891 RepID=UPI0035C704A8